MAVEGRYSALSTGWLRHGGCNYHEMHEKLYLTRYNSCFGGECEIQLNRNDGIRRKWALKMNKIFEMLLIKQGPTIASWAEKLLEKSVWTEHFCPFRIHMLRPIPQHDVV